VSGYREEVEASYLQDRSFVGQRVVVPASGASPATGGVLSDVAVHRCGVVHRLAGCLTTPGKPHGELLKVAVDHVELFLGGRIVALAPGDLVLVEPMPAAPAHS